MGLTPTKIRQLRQARGWSQMYLAVQVGVDRTTIVRWEAGKVVTLPALMKVLEEVLEVEEG